LKSADGAAQHNNQFKLETNTYDVAGGTLDAVYAQIRARGPGGYWAMARWNARYTYQSTRQGALCRISQLQIFVTGHILMPQWQGKERASRADQMAWDRMYEKLLRHEQGHVQYGREFAILLREQLAGMGAVPCDSLQARAQRIFDPLLASLRSRDRDYDRRTEHGIRQDNPHG
jgi:predicted secreted Zn-dependent protease